MRNATAVQKRQNIVRGHSAPTARGGVRTQWGGGAVAARGSRANDAGPGRSLQLRTAFRPQRKPFRLQSFTDKPAGWSIIITFCTRDSVIFAPGVAESIAMRGTIDSDSLVIDCAFCDMFALV